MAGDPFAITTYLTAAEHFAYGSRITCDKAGTLDSLALPVGATQLANIYAAIYDTGDAAAGFRTQLWKSSGEAVSATAGWQELFTNIGLAVVAGQALDLAIVTDASCEIGRWSPYTAAFMELPADWLVVPGGALPKLSWVYNLGSTNLPATIAEATCAATNNACAIGAYIS